MAMGPHVREFTGELRRLVDRSGMSVAGVADRAGGSRTSWEAYLSGRRLAPRSALVALAELTGADAGVLTALRERAERESAAGAATGSPASGQGAAPPAATGSGTAPARSRAPVPDRKVAAFAAGVVGALLVTASAVLLTDLGGDTADGEAARPPSPAASPGAPSRPSAQAPAASPSARATGTLPAGVRCRGSACAGQDPERMGCGGALARTLSGVTVGRALVEVRYSATCGAAWARISGPAPGDTVRISVAGATSGAAPGTPYTRMLATPDGAGARACATLAGGGSGCTAPAGAS